MLQRTFHLLTQPVILISTPVKRIRRQDKDEVLTLLDDPDKLRVELSGIQLFQIQECRISGIDKTLIDRVRQLQSPFAPVTYEYVEFLFHELS